MTGFELLEPQLAHVPLPGVALCAFCLLCTWKTGFDLFFAGQDGLGIWYMLVGSALSASLLVLL